MEISTAGPDSNGMESEKGLREDCLFFEFFPLAGSGACAGYTILDDVSGMNAVCFVFLPLSSSSSSFFPLTLLV